MRFIKAVLAVALLGACAPSVAEAPIPEQWRSAPLMVMPIELGAARLGALTFRGGVVLESQDRAFGGLSGLEVLEDGRLLAVSDAGSWFSARLRLDENGTLIGVDDARLASMRDEDGQVFADKEYGDAEDITQMGDGRFAVSFEQSQTIRFYDINRDGPFGAAVRGPVLAEVARLPSNAGLEAIAATQGGELLVGAEQSGVLWRAPVLSAQPVEPFAHYDLEFGFALTALDRLPDGDFVALERFYAPLIGAQARITRINGESLTAGGEARVTELALLRPPLVLDNFEGIAAVRAPNGGVRLYIVSDDNFSPRQRTLLYAFDMDDGGS